MSNFWREIQNGLSDCKYWGISEKILRKEYFTTNPALMGKIGCAGWLATQKAMDYILFPSK